MSMARPTLALTERLFRHTGLRPDQLTPDICWYWSGATSGATPVWKFKGRPTTVKRVLFEELIHPLHPWQRLAPTCTTILCVNPRHARVSGSPTSVERSFCEEGDEQMTLDEVVDTILQTDALDRDALATKYEIPRALVDQALEVIRTGGL
jgi:hypothetical protein